MPNSNRPMGLQPLGRSITGGCIQTVLRSKVVGYATRIRAFDVVNRVADASIERSITPGTTIISGVALNWGAASTATDHLVVEDPFQLFMAQGGGATGFAAADMGLNANVSLGSTSVYFSDDIINDGTEAASADLSVKLHNKVTSPDNDWGGYVKVVVQINQHRLHAGVLGV